MGIILEPHIAVHHPIPTMYVICNTKNSQFSSTDHHTNGLQPFLGQMKLRHCYHLLYLYHHHLGFGHHSRFLAGKFLTSIVATFYHSHHHHLAHDYQHLVSHCRTQNHQRLPLHLKVLPEHPGMARQYC